MRRVVDLCHERDRAVGVRAQQDLVVVHGAGDHEHVDVAGAAGVEDRDQARGRAALEGQEVGVAAVLAVEEI